MVYTCVVICERVVGVHIVVYARFVVCARTVVYCGAHARVCVQGIVLAGFVYVVELFPASQRTLMGMACQCFWAISMWVLALSAWLLPNWRHLTLCISLPGLCGLVMAW